MTKFLGKNSAPVRPEGFVGHVEYVWGRVPYLREQSYRSLFWLTLKVRYSVWLLWVAVALLQFHNE